MKQSRSVRNRPRYALVVAVVLGQGAIGCAFAQSTATSTKPAQQGTPSAVQASGLTVTVDPKTKQIRPPTPEETKALFDAQAVKTSVDGAGLQVYQYPNGMKAVVLPESYMETVRAAANPDGTRSFQCVSDKDAAATVAPKATPKVGASKAVAVKAGRTATVPARSATPNAEEK